MQLNANCTLCHQSLGDVYLRLGQPKEAEASMRRQVRTRKGSNLGLALLSDLSSVLGPSSAVL